MNIGKLRHFLRIEEPTTVAGAGDTTFTWTEHVAVWGAVEPISQRETPLAKSYAPTVSHRITIRYTDGVTTRMRVAFKSRTFYINGVTNYLERDKELTLYCTEVA